MISHNTQNKRSYNNRTIIPINYNMVWLLSIFWHGKTIVWSERIGFILEMLQYCWIYRRRQSHRLKRIDRCIEYRRDIHRRHIQRYFSISKIHISIFIGFIILIASLHTSFHMLNLILVRIKNIVNNRTINADC